MDVKRYFKYGFLVTMSSVMLAACGGGDDEENEGGAETSGPLDNAAVEAPEGADDAVATEDAEEADDTPAVVVPEDDGADDATEEEAEVEVEEEADEIVPDVDEEEDDVSDTPERIADDAELIEVELDRVVDGDTVHVIADGESLELRLLLIDTPETVHPDEPVQPYGPEASARAEDFLSSHSPLFIEYDTGGTQDHYGRELVYLYGQDSLGNIINFQEVLLEEGLARVGYIESQTRHLAQFQMRENEARAAGLGIWSEPGYVNAYGEGFNYTEDGGIPDASELPDTAADLDLSDYGQDPDFDFADCDELTAEFPNGVSEDHPAYKLALDEGMTGTACAS